MTNPDYRAMCAELLVLAEESPSYRVQAKEAVQLIDRARALLAEPVAEGLTDQELLRCAKIAAPCYDLKLWERELNMMRAAIAADRTRFGRPTPQPEEGDIHYAWELHDAEGDWQAGGSANSLEDVQREGNHYLQTYSQDGPYKLIIQRHCVSTIEEVTND